MNIYIHKNDQQLGPFDEAQIWEGLRNGEFTSENLAWHEGLPEWVQLSAILKIPQFDQPAPRNIQEVKNAKIKKTGIYISIAVGAAFFLGILMIVIFYGANHFTSSKQIKGEVFISTKGADTKRLSGVPIRFYKREILEKNFAESAQNAADAMPPYENTINRIHNEILETKKNLDELEKSGGSGGAHHRLVLATMDVKKAKEDLLQVWVNIMNAWPHASYYFNLLPQPEFETRSDSDGKFAISLPKGDWIIVAQASRHLGGSTEDEWYFWTCTIKESDANLLSNHNLVTSGNSESVLKTKMGKKTLPD